MEIYRRLSRSRQTTAVKSKRLQEKCLLSFANGIFTFCVESCSWKLNFGLTKVINSGFKKDVNFRKKKKEKS